MTDSDDPKHPDDPFPTPIVFQMAAPAPARSWRTWLTGRPVPTGAAPRQTIGKLFGLAVFAADALSSIAYAPQQTLVILAAAGPQAYGYAFWIALVITALLAVVTISCQQTLHAYPNGGGAYTVALENLGEIPAQIAGVALLIDYVFLAAVAISSGVAQIVSAYPPLFASRVEIALALLGLIMIANLRGVKESGAVFAVPTYFFVGMMNVVVGAGVVRLLSGTLGPVLAPPTVELLHGAQPLTLLLPLRAFANGTTALTGVECISNGAPVSPCAQGKMAGWRRTSMALEMGCQQPRRTGYGDRGRDLRGHGIPGLRPRPLDRPHRPVRRQRSRRARAGSA